MLFRKKPVVIEAICLKSLLPEDVIKVLEFMGQKVPTKTLEEWEHFADYIDLCEKRKGMPIDTLEGEMIAGVGDYIIKGIKGEFYPCKPDIFAKTYEFVNKFNRNEFIEVADNIDDYLEGATITVIKSVNNSQSARVFRNGTDSGNESTLVELVLSKPNIIGHIGDNTILFGVECGTESSDLAKTLRKIADNIDSYKY